MGGVVGPVFSLFMVVSVPCVAGGRGVGGWGGGGGGGRGLENPFLDIFCTETIRVPRHNGELNTHLHQNNTYYRRELMAKYFYHA